MNEILRYDSWNESPERNIGIVKHVLFVIEPAMYQPDTVYGGFLTHHSQVSQLLFLFLLRQLKRESGNLPGQLLQTLPKLWTL